MHYTQRKISGEEKRMSYISSNLRDGQEEVSIHGNTVNVGSYLEVSLSILFTIKLWY